MPNNTVPGFIFDAYGRQAYFGGNGVLHQRTSDDDRLRPRQANHFADYIALLGSSRYRELVSECRAIASRGIVAAILEQKADYIAASHYCPRFLGTDSVYGEEALEALLGALQICNVRGSRHDWRTTWRLSVPTRATDGSFFVLLTSWGDTGWPALQVLEGHRIGQRDGGMSGVVGTDDALTIITAEDGSTQEVRGAYRGLRIHNGVIYNLAGTEVAYRVLGGSKDEDEDISARDMIHVARPRRHSEGRPAPEMATAILDFLAIDLAQTCQLDQQIQDSRLTFVESNATGKYDAAHAFVAPYPGTTANGSPTEVIERGMTRILKSGNELKPHESKRPSDQWMNFDWRVLQRACAAIRWRAEMLDPSKLGGAANRAFQDQINTCIHDEFAIDAPAATRAVRYFVAKLTKLGVIRKHDEWDQWGIAPPPWFEVDRASAKIDIDDVAAGRMPMSVLHGRDGHTTAEVYRQRVNAYKLALAMQEAEKAASGIVVPLEIFMGDLGNTAQRSGYFPHADPSPDPAVPQPPPKAGPGAPNRGSPNASVSTEQIELERFQEVNRHAEIMAGLTAIASRTPVTNVSIPAATASERAQDAKNTLAILAGAIAAQKPATMTFNIPPQAAPIVNVKTPEVRVEPHFTVEAAKAPIVNVAAAAPLPPVPAPNVVVNVPQQPPPVVHNTVNVPPLNAELKIKRDQSGKMTGGKIS